MLDEKPDFDIWITFGLILKGNAGEIHDLLNVIKTDFKDVKIVFTKTAIGRLMIVDGVHNA